MSRSRSDSWGADRVTFQVVGGESPTGRRPALKGSRGDSPVCKPSHNRREPTLAGGHGLG